MENPNPAIKIVIANVMKQSRSPEKIAAHLSGARNDTLIKHVRYVSPDLGKTCQTMDCPVKSDADLREESLRPDNDGF